MLFESIRLKLLSLPLLHLRFSLFGAQNLPYGGWFDAQRWLGFLRVKQVEYSYLDREVYSILEEVDEKAIFVELKGQKYQISMDSLGEAYGIPNQGSKVIKKGDAIYIKGYNETSFKREILENPNINESHDVKSSYMKPHSRVLHKLITYYISSKKTSVISMLVQLNYLLYGISKSKEI